MPLTQVQGQMLSGSNNTTTTIQSNGTTAITIDSSQNVGIGTSSPTTVANKNLQVYAGSGASAVVRVTGNAGTGFDFLQGTDGVAYVWNRDNTATLFGTNNAERMRINSSGNVGIGTASPSGRLHPVSIDSTSSNWNIYATNSNGTAMFALRNDNYLFAPSVGNYGTTGTTVVINGNFLGYLSSSIRFKKDIVDYDKGLNVISNLRPVYYKSSNPNQDGIYDERTYAGFIAEEVKELGLEEFIDYNSDGEVTSLKYGQMTALLCKAIQELKGIVDTQATKIAELEAKLEAK